MADDEDKSLQALTRQKSEDGGNSVSSGSRLSFGGGGGHWKDSNDTSLFKRTSGAAKISHTLDDSDDSDDDNPLVTRMQPSSASKPKPPRISSGGDGFNKGVSSSVSQIDEVPWWSDHSSDTGDGADDSSWSEDPLARIVGDDEGGESDGKRGREGKYLCSVCGIRLHKPALLKQHMTSHSDKRPYTCPVENCGKSYKRQDHLNRHSLTHKGKLFMCPMKGCDVSFTMNSNLQRHVGLHEKWDSELLSGQKGVALDSLKCPQPCCSKKFKYPSLLQTHLENVHESIVVDQVVCMELGCGEVFADVSQLQAHRKLSHCHVTCDVCGLSMLRRQLKMHILLHTGGAPRIPCSHPGCRHTYSSKSNLDTHIRAVHMELKPYECSQCTMRTSYKVVRDKHEAVVHSRPSEVVDFEAEDHVVRMKPQGGRKRVMIQQVDDLFVKRPAFQVLSESSGRRCYSS